ncbi:hypothetical protein TraAM80_08265 [Trypanosoma rangeli]|uniref:Uncharacterized protein n=1 Tax=Trypanosoma rangeli TaxID=5698 RepID=A0A3R7MAV3_TRYRA|nr:uncharacterized protein TraAM80_08265 [Trypanosoma rangeli]RNE99296.1 hypothetical protein TraAM80_08265 [Trypanosoma rangeli]|eukprot:RNE99296.1 hypothetical protein TraAM80_08265 [Trypanosoma rangeli]
MSSRLDDSRARDEAGVRRHLVRFYEEHNPQKLNSIETILFVYRGHWDELFVELAEKYKLVSQRPDTATQCCCASFHRSFPVGDDSSMDDSLCPTSNGSAVSSPFNLLDPMVVVQRRLNDRKGSDAQSSSMPMPHGEKQNKMRKVGDSTLSSCLCSGDAQDDIVRQLRRQQLFMRFAPKEGLHMEELMTQSREAYMMSSNCDADCIDGVAEGEWEEAMMRDLLHKVDREKSNEDNHNANPSPHKLFLTPSPLSFASRMLFPFDPADPLEAGSPLETRYLHGLHATEPCAPELGRREGRSTTTRPLPFHAQSALISNVDELMHSPVETFVDEWCDPLGGNGLANAAEALLALEQKELLQPNSTSIRNMVDAEATEENAELRRNGDSPLSSVILSLKTHGKKLCMMFYQTQEERQAERLLAHPVMRRALACPHLHYRLFLLFCISLERAQGKIVPPQRDTFLAVWKGGEHMPCWEPSLEHRVLWRGSSPRDESCIFYTE